MKVLNLYAGIGGNRELWENVEVTAVEQNEELAAIYQKRFPGDKVVIADAREYLLSNYEEFDFIWASPPCQSHSNARYLASGGGDKSYNTYAPIYPDFSLYEVVTFLKYFFKGKWVVENVVSYYKPLIEPTKVGKHYFWSNFEISNINIKTKHFGSNFELARDKNIDYSLLDGISIRKDQILRNTMNSKIGLHVFDCSSNLNKVNNIQ